MKIYVASSWRNPIQQAVVAALHKAGHKVYDFRNPAPDNHGFHWSEIDPNWQQWNGQQFATALQHPVAESGFALDKEALDWCEACLLVLPSGRSAHLEAGYTIGQGKSTAILLADQQEPELMYKLAEAHLLTTEAVVQWADSVALRLAASPAKHEFTCPRNKRTADSYCGREIEQEGTCHRCCYGCARAQDMTCTVVCSYVAEHYHGHEEEQAKEGKQA